MTPPYRDTTAAKIGTRLSLHSRALVWILQNTGFPFDFAQGMLRLSWLSNDVFEDIVSQQASDHERSGDVAKSSFALRH